MKISMKVNILILLIMIFIGIGTVGVEIYMFSKLEENQRTIVVNQNMNARHEKSNFYVEAINRRIEMVGKRALGIASLFSRDPVVIDAYRIALSGNIDDPRSPESQEARDMLRDAFAPILEGYISNTGEKLLKLHFHLPNARSLVRLWRKGYQTVVNGKKVDISDDISSFRNTVKAVNTPPYKPITGIEIGRGGFVIRGIAPVQDQDGKHLGSVEVLYPFSEVMIEDKKKSLFYAVYMDADQLPIAKSLQDSSKYPVVAGKYVLTDSTRRSVTDRLITPELLDKGHRESTMTQTGNYHIMLFPIKDYSGKTVGVMSFAFDTSESLKTLRSVTESIASKKKVFIGIFVLIITVLTVIGVVIAILVVGSSLKPLKRFDGALKQITSGHANLKQRITLKSKDEIGNLVETFNTFLGKLQKIIMKIKETVETTVSVQESLGASNEETLAAITEITANIESARNMIRSLSDKLESARSNTENIGENIEELDRIITDQASSVEQASASVNQIVASVDSVAGITQDRQRATEKLVDDTKNGEEVLIAAMQAVKDIGNSIQSIGEMVKVIKDVSAKTNLLAMNAAIEAAHAGEAGRGFSVVADEIRKLAESVAGESKEINSELEGIIQKIENAVSTGDKAGKSFVKIRSEVEDTFNAFSEIANSAAELSNGGREVLKVVARLNDVTIKVREDSGNIRRNVDGFKGIMEEVSRVSSEVIGAIDEIVVGTGEINRAMEQTVGLTTLLSDSASTLKEEVDNFEV